MKPNQINSDYNERINRFPHSKAIAEIVGRADFMIMCFFFQKYSTELGKTNDKIISKVFQIHSRPSNLKRGWQNWLKLCFFLFFSEKKKA